MFCPTCGSNLPEGVKFCQACGTAISAAPAQPAAPAAPVAPVNFDADSTIMADAPAAPFAPVAPVAPVAQQPMAAPMAPVAAMAPQPPKKSKGPAIAITITAIIAVIGIVVAILFGTGVIGDSKKDDDDDKDTKESVTQQIDEDEEEKTNAEDIYEPSGVAPPPATVPVVTQPPVSASNDEATIKSVINTYYASLTSFNGTALKNVMSSYIEAAFNQSYDTATINSLRNDPSVVAECESYGIDVNSADFIYAVYAVGMLEDLGGVDYITSISVNSVTLGSPLSQADINDIPTMMYQELGIYATGTSSITAGYEVSAIVTIYDVYGTSSTQYADFIALLENGQWRIIPV